MDTFIHPHARSPSYTNHMVSTRANLCSLLFRCVFFVLFCLLFTRSFFVVDTTIRAFGHISSLMDTSCKRSLIKYDTIGATLNPTKRVPPLIPQQVRGVIDAERSQYSL